jgi:threonine-phosphate decarboxylase
MQVTSWDSHKEPFMYPHKEIVHGGDVLSAMEKTGRSALLDFSANVNPLGLPESVRHAVIQGLEQSTSYPDPLCRSLRCALSQYEGVPHPYILCAGGANDLIFRLAYALRPKLALLLAPTFAEYELALTQANCRCIHHMLREEDAFLPRPSLVQEAENCDLVLLCNPNNPTGALIDPALMEQVLDTCIRTGAVLAVDECFLDFLPNEEEHTLKKKLEHYNKLIILRAFTKIFAIPGLRLGYALSSGTELLRKMDQAGPSWNVSVPAQLAGVAAIKETAYLQKTRCLIATERAWLQEALSALGLKVYPGAANYLFLRCQDRSLSEKLMEQGVLIRDCSNYRGLEPGYFRVAVRNRMENTALVRAMKECL